MPDFDVDGNYKLLTAITEGKSWYELRADYPDLSFEEYENLCDFVENCRKRHPNAWRRWTDEESQLLYKRNYEGASVEEIAHELGRSARAIEFMLAPRKRKSA